MARRLGRLSSVHRRELRELMGSPPDPARVPPEFWQRVRTEREKELAALLLLTYLASANQHGLTDSMFGGAGVPSREGAAWSKSRAGIASYQYTETSRDILLRRAAEAEEAGTVLRPGDLIDVFGPDRDESAAITETTGAATAGGDAAISHRGGITVQDLWITERDSKVCPICKPLHTKPRSDWARFFPSGPPAHPRCRCYIQYANEATR